MAVLIINWLSHLSALSPVCLWRNMTTKWLYHVSKATNAIIMLLAISPSWYQFVFKSWGLLQYGIFHGQTWRLPTCTGATGAGQAGVRNFSPEPDTSTKPVHRLESKMIKASEATKLEGSGGFAEYAAAGKLEGQEGSDHWWGVCTANWQKQNLRG